MPKKEELKRFIVRLGGYAEFTPVVLLAKDAEDAWNKAYDDSHLLDAGMPSPEQELSEVYESPGPDYEHDCEDWTEDEIE